MMKHIFLQLPIKKATFNTEILLDIASIQTNCFIQVMGVFFVIMRNC